MEQEFQNPIEGEIRCFERESLAKASEFGPDPYLTPDGAVVVQFGNSLLLESSSTVLRPQLADIARVTEGKRGPWHYK